MEREQKEAIVRDLHKKMVFLTGPRQAGKTTLSISVAQEFDSHIYLNFDVAEDRRVILDRSWHPSVELVILDEIHKLPDWKNYLKGVYDGRVAHQKFLVTGSARLEVFTEVGDSLAGRFFLHRLLPLSPSECEKVKAPYSVEHFLERGGFPEPFLAENKTEADRWRLQYVDSLLRTDVLDFENIQNVKAIRLIFEMLQERVGSPISYSSIAQDVSISPNTVKKYIQILEALYIVFRITPFSRNIVRSLLKEPKIYFFDLGLVRGDPGVVFENLIALSLLKFIYKKVDYEAQIYALHYLQTKERREVDFALVLDKKLEKLIEVKLSNGTPSRSLHYFHERYDVPAVQVVKDLKKEKIDHGIELISGINFLKRL
ncbi:MAG: ATP-binding protein [Chlamydiales bacterium]|nr:ATP-binding protein [Chlamydiales bacterium]